MKYLNNFISLFVLHAVFLNVVKAAPTDDLVTELPGFGRTPTLQYSGYLDATDGCDKKSNGFCRLHYWFAEAEGPDAASKPVVLWLNGGPGSSSIFGFLQENGPLLINVTGGLMVNPWSWTKASNFFVLEAPVGVGFSYCETQLNNPETGLCKNTDKFTASASRAALIDFFTTKFPELADNEFFITGESYAGVYVPTLAKEILDHASDVINLVGIAVGDPCTDQVAQSESMDSLWYSHKYGLVPDQDFDLLWNKCKARHSALGQSIAMHGKRFVAHKLRKLLTQELSVSSLANVDFADPETTSAIDKMMKSTNEFYKPGPNFQETPECKVAYRKFLVSTSNGLSQSWPRQWVDDYALFISGGVMSEDEQMENYMMRSDVRAALHVEECPSKQWPNPLQGFDYTNEYAACNENYPEGTPSMIEFYKEIVPKLDTTLVYNGDTDPCVSYEGTRIAVSRMGFDEIDGGAYRPWFYNHTATSDEVILEIPPLFGPDLLLQDIGAQFGGEIVNYEHNLAFATVHGSGHMVPQFRPQAAFHILQKVIRREHFSPLLPTNETIASMSINKFEKTLDGWTDRAKKYPYVLPGVQHVLIKSTNLDERLDPLPKRTPWGFVSVLASAWQRICIPLYGLARVH